MHRRRDHVQLGARHRARAHPTPTRDPAGDRSSSWTRRTHDLHRGLLVSWVFTPEADARAGTAGPSVLRAPSIRWWAPAASTSSPTSVRDADADLGMLLGIPEDDQEDVRDRHRRRPPHRAAVGMTRTVVRCTDLAAGVRRLHRLARPPPVRRPDDRAAEAEFEDETGAVRRLTDDEVVATSTSSPVPGTRRPAADRLGRQGARRAPRPARRARGRPGLVRVPSRSCCATSRRRPSGPLRHRDVELHGHPVPEGSVMLLLDGAAEPRRAHVPDPDRFDIHRRHRPAPLVRLWHPLLHRRRTSPASRAASASRRSCAASPTWEVDCDRAVRALTSTVRGWASLPVHTL